MLSSTRFVLAAMMLLASASPAHAHRLDEYLQATTIAVARDRVSLQIRLTPGVAVFSRVLATMDANADGLLSDAEQRAYAERVLRELSLAIDDDRLALRLIASTFASVADMKEGRGDIVIDFDAVAPRGGGDRRLSFENRHLPAVSVYLVNALVSRDADIRFTHQSRNYEQSSYQMDYAQAGPRSGSLSLRSLFAPLAWVSVVVFLSLAPIAVFIRLRRRVASGLTGAPRKRAHATAR